MVAWVWLSKFNMIIYHHFETDWDKNYWNVICVQSNSGVCVCVRAGVEWGGGGPRTVLLPVQCGLIPRRTTHHLSAGRRCVILLLLTCDVTLLSRLVGFFFFLKQFSAEADPVNVVNFLPFSVLQVWLCPHLQAAQRMQPQQEPPWSTPTFPPSWSPPSAHTRSPSGPSSSLPGWSSWWGLKGGGWIHNVYRTSLSKTLGHHETPEQPQLLEKILWTPFFLSYIPSIGVPWLWIMIHIIFKNRTLLPLIKASVFIMSVGLAFFFWATIP